MTTLLVLAKAPVAGRSKTRLTPPCSPQEAADLAEPRGLFNVDDIQFWAESFVAGCPGG